MIQCRNCGSSSLTELGFVGDIAPFFLKRVFHLQSGFPAGIHPLVRMVRRRTTFLRDLFQKIYRPSTFVELQICCDCSFLQTKYPFVDSSINNLYADYRSDSYNEERIKYEPAYAELAQRVGIDEQEIRSRVIGLTEWLRTKLDPGVQLSMLDFGGADGRFLPDFPGAKTVFEVSNVPPCPGVVKIESEAGLGTYSYVQLAHVLEHVPHPLALVRKVASLLKSRGYLYLEVPQEIDEATIAKLRNGDNKSSFIIHEHINRYTPQGIAAVLKNAGLEIIAVEAEVADLGWTSAPIIRGLAWKL